MKKILFLFFMSITMSQAQTAPALDFFCELKVKLDPALIVGETPHGTRRIIPIIGGTVEGPKIKGEILNGGADWQILRADGVTELEAHYQFRTDDGTLIYIAYTGSLDVGADAAAALRHYLELSPGAEDAAFVHQYLSELEGTR